jgi:8-amino-7-oxononanoate synthase
VFSSGYLANLGAVTALAGAGSLVVSDAQNHASLVDACRLARGDVVVTAHRDVAAVNRALADRRTEQAVVVTDAVFSVDGDLAPLAELHRTARHHGALLVVDEAHGLGVVGPEGRGAAAAAGIAGEPDVVLTLTLSKSLGAQGGAVLADPVVIEHLVNTARAFIFDTGLPRPRPRRRRPRCLCSAPSRGSRLQCGPGLGTSRRRWLPPGCP